MYKRVQCSRDFTGRIQRDNNTGMERKIDSGRLTDVTREQKLEKRVYRHRGDKIITFLNERKS
jgi:transposase